MEFFIILASIKAIFLGAVYGRLDGGGIAKTSEWVERSLIMFFFVLACAPFAGLWALAAYLGVVGIATGHGQYFLERALEGQAERKESVDPFVSLFFGEDWRVCFKESRVFTDHEEVYYAQDIRPRLYWRCVFGMFVTGTLIGLPAVVLSLSFGAYLPALLFSLTGFAKAVAYVVGYEFWRSTEPAEYINGGLRNALCVGVITMLLL